MSKANILNLCKAMSEKAPSLVSLKIRLDILNLSHLAHHKKGDDIARWFGPLKPEYQEIQTEINNIIDQKKLLQKQIDELEQEKSATH